MRKKVFLNVLQPYKDSTPYIYIFEVEGIDKCGVSVVQTRTISERVALQLLEKCRIMFSSEYRSFHIRRRVLFLDFK